MNHALQVKDDLLVSQLSRRILPKTTPPESEIRQILTDIVNGMELSTGKQPLSIDGYPPETFLKKYKTKILDAIQKNRIDVVNDQKPKKLHLSLSPVLETTPRHQGGWQGDVFAVAPKSQ
jgi:hypothetical protein